MVTVLGLAVLWYLVASSISSGSVATVFSALTLMLYILVPWTATNLVDFFVVRRGHYAIADLFTPNGIYGAWGWRGLTAFAIGLLSEIPFMVLPTIGDWSFVGPVASALGDVDIAWLVGLAVTSVAYWLLGRSLDLAAEESERRRSDEQLSGQGLA